MLVYVSCHVLERQAPCILANLSASVHYYAAYVSLYLRCFCVVVFKYSQDARAASDARRHATEDQFDSLRADYEDLKDQVRLAVVARLSWSCRI